MEKEQFENIEYSWSLLIDGLTIQRYFLHVFPWLKQKFPGAYIIHKDLMDDVARNTYKQYHADSMDSQLHTIQVGTKKIYYLNHSIEKLLESFRIIQDSRYFWIVDLGVSIILNESICDYAICPNLFSIVNNDSSLTPLDIAAKILSDGAKSLMRQFVRSLEIEIRIHELEQEFSFLYSKSHKVEQYLEDIFASAILYNFCDRQNDPNLEELKMREVKNLKEKYSDVCRVTEIINDIVISDLLLRYVPGSERYVPYLKGKGAGQL